MFERPIVDGYIQHFCFYYNDDDTKSEIWFWIALRKNEDYRRRGEVPCSLVKSAAIKYSDIVFLKAKNTALQDVRFYNNNNNLTMKSNHCIASSTMYLHAILKYT